MISTTAAPTWLNRCRNTSAKAPPSTPPLPSLPDRVPAVYSSPRSFPDHSNSVVQAKRWISAPAMTVSRSVQVTRAPMGLPRTMRICSAATRRVIGRT